jgi:predicted ATPase
MIDRLQRLVDEISALHSKLVLLIGVPGSGKTELLQVLGKNCGAMPLKIGSALGSVLAAIPQKQRPIQANTMMRELADQHAVSNLLLLDNIELLFDRTLQLNPLDLLKRHAHARRVVAAWPGELRDGRLIYATMGHPEHQDYGLEGLIPFAIQ